MSIYGGAILPTTKCRWIKNMSTLDAIRVTELLTQHYIYSLTCCVVHHHYYTAPTIFIGVRSAHLTVLFLKRIRAELLFLLEFKFVNNFNNAV